MIFFNHLKVDFRFMWRTWRRVINKSLSPDPPIPINDGVYKCFFENEKSLRSLSTLYIYDFFI